MEQKIKKRINELSNKNKILTNLCKKYLNLKYFFMLNNTTNSIVINCSIIEELKNLLKEK